MQTKYLIIGSSHAGLSAADEIRVHDSDSPLTMISMEDCLPYSPTILPYILEGKVEEKNVYLRDEKFFQDKKINFLRGKKAVKVDPSVAKVELDDGREISYEKLLIATGSEPTLPPIPGLKESPYYVLRTMEDAKRINAAAMQAKSAVILGTGLVGMHAAEALGRKGLKVTMVELLPQILPGYFDAEAAKFVQGVFTKHGIAFYLNNPAVKVESSSGTTKISLKEGQEIEGELPLVATGVKPRVEFLRDTNIQIEQGIIVDEFMRTSQENIWAAGDVAQGKDFFTSKTGLNAILPDAYEQGKIAGLSMAGDPAVIMAFEELGQELAFSYPGGINRNTFNFYGNRSFSVGLALATEEDGYEIDKMFFPGGGVYQKLVFQGEVLVGAIGINVTLDPGVILNLIRRKVLLGNVKSEFVVKPLEMSRQLMWSHWRGVAVKRN